MQASVAHRGDTRSIGGSLSRRSEAGPCSRTTRSCDGGRPGHRLAPSDLSRATARPATHLMARGVAHKWPSIGRVSAPGMGAVILMAHPGFSMFTGLGMESFCCHDVRIPSEFTGFRSMWASLWQASATGWNPRAFEWTGSDTIKWPQIDVAGSSCSSPDPNPSASSCTTFITLIKAEEAGGGTGGTVPEPSSFPLLGVVRCPSPPLSRCSGRSSPVC